MKWMHQRKFFFIHLLTFGETHSPLQQWNLLSKFPAFHMQSTPGYTQEGHLFTHVNVLVGNKRWVKKQKDRQSPASSSKEADV